MLQFPNPQFACGADLFFVGLSLSLFPAVSDCLCFVRSLNAIDSFRGSDFQSGPQFPRALPFLQVI